MASISPSHQRAPPCRCFGEQVASKDADAWIDLVQDDMEALGYAVGAVPFPAASVGSPHIRDRLYWVADSSGEIDQRKRFSGIPGQGWSMTRGNRCRKRRLCSWQAGHLHGVGLIRGVKDSRPWDTGKPLTQ